MTAKRESQNFKDSLESWLHRASPHKESSQDDYLVAMKRAHRALSMANVLNSPRARHRMKVAAEEDRKAKLHSRDIQELIHISTIASMVPDEIINDHYDYSLRTYDTALMFIDVSGFTELCESYTKSGRGGPSKLTQVLNSYIGAMVQEILSYNGDVLKFSGDAFLSMWKKNARMTMQDVVHTAIDCGLIIQKNYSTHETDLGIILKVKVAISAGECHFCIIGGEATASYIIVGQPVWDVKSAEYVSTAGEVVTSASIWAYVNESEYCTQPCGDGRHTKVLGVGVTWKRVEKLSVVTINDEKNSQDLTNVYLHGSSFMGFRGNKKVNKPNTPEIFVDTSDQTYKEYSLRPAVVSAIQSSWWPSLCRFVMSPVLRAVDNDEAMDFLTEVRHVVVLFVNVITKNVPVNILMDIVDACYKQVYSVTLESGGLVNKVNMFDKDMMFLVVFGLRGLKHEDEAQKALLCAYQVKRALQNQDPNILNVSIGVTSGRTYCGVVGHVLRREYTVIGSSVNKAARLMISYPNKVTCDKETFVRSKLDLDLFRLMPPKPLKGIGKPGPIYEFSRSGWPDRSAVSRHLILGRNEEVRTYKQVLQNAIDHQHEEFTRYRYMRYGIVVLGPLLVGKKRVVDEFITVTPEDLKIMRITLTANDKSPYNFIRLLLLKLCNGNTNTNNVRDLFSTRIRQRIGAVPVSPLQIHAINEIFNLRFPLPDNFNYSGDILSEHSVTELICEIYNVKSSNLIVLIIHDGHFIDDKSWRLLLRILDMKDIFAIITICDQEEITDVARSCIENNIFVKMVLRGIDRWYHAALACQLLDVQAIPADLEKVLESASGGLPGWIQNFVISLIQRGDLTVVTVPRSEAVDSGAVMPLTAMLYKYENKSSDINVLNVQSEATENDNVQMAVLAPNFNFGEMKMDMTMDVMILKTFDSLTPFEKMLLKCGSVLGDVFSRRILLHLLQSDSQRKVALAVAKLFEIRVLQCEGGDFSHDTSKVLIHPAPAITDDIKPPNCSCLGTRVPPSCRDLPMYAFCGYMKFRHSLFRTTTYELLTENQKQEMHARSLVYLERYTRRCIGCGSGCFIKLFGVRSDDGMIMESRELRRVRKQIADLSKETKITSEYLSDTGVVSMYSGDTQSDDGSETMRRSKSIQESQRLKPVRSFSSIDLDNCECLPILLSVYNQAVDDCRVIGNCQKLFQVYMEYVDLSLLSYNIPQAIRLLMEVEKEVQENTYCHSDACKIDWMNDYRRGRISAMRGYCMLESGDVSEARKYLLQAMRLYGCKFPTSKSGVKFSDMQASIQQQFSLRFSRPPETSTGWVGRYYDNIAMTLIYLYRLFTECREVENATLAAKWSLKFAMKSNSTFRVLCLSYGNMISTYRQKRKVSKCLKLGKLAMDVCHRKRGKLDITEVYAVCSLYTNIFLFYVEHGKDAESLDFGLSVIPIMSSQPDITVRHMMLLWLMKILVGTLRINEMVKIMTEFFFMSDHYDMSSEVWYYYFSVVILLDTGLCVESYNACEKFYIKQGDAILRSRTPEAAWNFFVCMWLVTLRIGAWENSILWDEKIEHILTLKFQCTEYNIMMLVRLVEGFLITMVNEINNGNLKKLIALEKTVQKVFKLSKLMCQQVPIFKPRYLLLYAYYHLMRGKKSQCFRHLNKALGYAQQYNIKTMIIWIIHNKNYWKGTLPPKLVNYWCDHIIPDNMLDYKTFDPDKTPIIPYTLPLPAILQFEK